VSGFVQRFTYRVGPARVPVLDDRPQSGGHSNDDSSKIVMYRLSARSRSMTSTSVRHARLGGLRQVIASSIKIQDDADLAKVGIVRSSAMSGTS
jgi:hypothetical protein